MLYLGIVTDLVSDFCPLQPGVKLLPEQALSRAIKLANGSLTGEVFDHLAVIRVIIESELASLQRSGYLDEDVLFSLKANYSADSLRVRVDFLGSSSRGLKPPPKDMFIGVDWAQEPQGV